MAQRFLHPAPYDYAIVELRDESGPSRFVLYHDGSELCICASAQQATRIAEEHRLRLRRPPPGRPHSENNPPLSIDKHEGQNP